MDRLALGLICRQGGADIGDNRLLGADVHGEESRAWQENALLVAILLCKNLFVVPRAGLWNELIDDTIQFLARIEVVVSMKDNVNLCAF